MVTVIKEGIGIFKKTVYYDTRLFRFVKEPKRDAKMEKCSHGN